MSTDGRYAGMPSWADLTTPDPVAAARFYGGLFGWEPLSAGPADVTGGYLVFRRHGRDVTGLARLKDDQPPSWTIYFGVGDVEEAEEAVVTNGGATLVPPTEVLDTMRMAVFTDPDRAVFGVWEPPARPGVDTLASPGTVCWQQLMSRDPATVQPFYRAVLGWDVTSLGWSYGSETPYGSSSLAMFTRSGEDMAGMVEMGSNWPANLPPHWMVHFAVEDCDAVASRVAALGGELSVEPTDVGDLGRTAVLADPHGAVFSVMVPGLRLIRRSVSDV